MANNDDTMTADKLAEVIKAVSNAPELPSFTTILMNSAHEKAFKNTTVNIPRKDEPMGYGMRKADSGDPVLGMADRTHMGMLGTFATQARVKVSPSVQAETWKIPLLSESVDVSPEVRKCINNTLMGFGKTPVVYVINEDLMRKYIDDFFNKSLTGAFTNTKL